MYPILVIVFGVFLTTAGAVVQEQVRAKQVVSLSGDVAAVNFLTYRASVARYFNTNSPSGTIADASLSWPTGYVRDLRWANVIVAGTLYVYTTVPADPGMLQKVHERTGKYVMVGTKTPAGNLISIGGMTIITSLPGAIPVGALVYVGG